MKPLTFPNQKIKPLRTYYDESIGEQVDVYEESAFNYKYGDSSGVQCGWFTNGAELNNPNEFGLKVGNQTGSDDELQHGKTLALAMFQRQRLAAKHGAAPVVHRMVRVILDKYNDEDWWGYQSGVAETYLDYKYKHRIKKAVANKLRKIPVSGLQQDRKPIGVGFPVNTYMGNDLHDGNVGIWRRKHVQIDFGYHCVEGWRRMNPDVWSDNGECDNDCQDCGCYPCVCNFCSECGEDHCCCSDSGT